MEKAREIDTNSPKNNNLKVIFKQDGAIKDISTFYKQASIKRLPKKVEKAKISKPLDAKAESPKKEIPLHVRELH